VFIETLEDCEFVFFRSQRAVVLKRPRFERAYRILMERHLAVTQNRLFETIAKSATDKYVAFLEQYPEHGNRFAHILLLIWESPSCSKVSKNSLSFSRHSSVSCSSSMLFLFYFLQFCHI
jgi:hypothetical protein